MSGRPVFNQNGELVAIIGRTKYAFGGLDAYRFDDGSTPAEELLEKLGFASWAILVYKLNQQDNFLKIINTNVSNFLDNK